MIKRTAFYKNADKMKDLSEKKQKELFNDARQDVGKVLNTKVLQKERDLYLPAIQALKGKGPMRLDDMLKTVEKKSKELLQENAAKAPKEMRP